MAKRHWLKSLLRANGKMPRAENDFAGEWHLSAAMQPHHFFSKHSAEIKKAFI